MLQTVYVRYIAASAVALGGDLLAFKALLMAGAAPAVAAAAGYLAGVIVHWALSSRAVFHDGLAERGTARWQQQSLFLGSALVGLALTTGIVGLGSKLGLNPMLAKLAAIAVSFQVTYVLRKKLVFA